MLLDEKYKQMQLAFGILLKSKPTLTMPSEGKRSATAGGA